MRNLILLIPLIILPACTAQDINAALGVAGESGLMRASMADGIRQTLELSSKRASSALSQTGAYAGNPALRIELPQQIQVVSGTLRRFGMGGGVGRIETLMNQAAEQAAAEAKSIFWRAIRNMTIGDAMGIVRGPENAATLYFRIHTESQLKSRYRPVIQRNLQQIGFYEEYRSFLSVYNALPIAGKANLDLEQHVLEKSLDGLFLRMAQEEALIRRDPVGRGSAVIGTVFGR